MTDAFPLVLAGHLIGDWVVQTDWQAANKTTRWDALFAHLIGYHLTLGSFAAFGFAAGWRFNAFLAISYLTHGFIDRRWPVIWLMEHTGSVPFSKTTFGVIAVDQALHLSILSLAVVVLT